MSRTNGPTDEIQNTPLDTNPFAENSIRKKDINSRKLLANLGGLKVFHKILVISPDHPTLVCGAVYSLESPWLPTYDGLRSSLVSSLYLPTVDIIDQTANTERHPGVRVERDRERQRDRE